MAEHLWLVGSPDTVEKKLRQLYEVSGGFGTLLVLIYDYWEDQAGWERSMQLLARQVMPRVADLTPALARPSP
jgi:alkanesulfonate monooxygenase SsuD/methylene tetrahydromethanopterin reductase-like flavin-dependent oxidoreductase (luciferase family)